MEKDRYKRNNDLLLKSFPLSVHMKEKEQLLRNGRAFSREISINPLLGLWYIYNKKSQYSENKQSQLLSKIMKQKLAISVCLIKLTKFTL